MVEDAVEMVVIPKVAATVPSGDEVGRVLFPRGSVGELLPEVIFPDEPSVAMDEEETGWVLDPAPQPPCRRQRL